MNNNIFNKSDVLDRQFHQRMEALPTYEQWAAKNPLHAGNVTPTEYLRLSEDRIINEVYGRNSRYDPRVFSWIGDGSINTNPNARWYELTTLPGGFGVIPAHPTTQKIAGGVVGVITAAALLVWAGQSSSSGNNQNALPDKPAAVSK